MPSDDVERRSFKFLPLSLRLETLGGLATPLVLCGTPLPAKRVENFTTASDNQNSVELHVLMGESPLAKKGISLGKFHLKGIPPAKKGEPSITVTFQVDPSCSVHAVASIKGKQLEASSTLTPDPKHLSDDSVERLKREAGESQEEDQATASLIEARNSAEQAIHEAENLLASHNEGKTVVTDPEAVAKEIALVGQALEAEGANRIRERTQRLKARLKPNTNLNSGLFDDIFSGFFTSPSPARTVRQPPRTANVPRRSVPQPAPPEQIARAASNELPLGKIFGGGDFILDPNLCFVLMPLAETFRPIFEDHIKPTVQGKGLKCLRADEIVGTSLITRDIWEMINRARFLIADLTGQNPNVFYEVGLAHALGKDVLLLTQTMTDVPFDLKAMRCIVYNYTPRGMKDMEVALQATISAMIESA